MKDIERSLTTYYAARAPEYDRVYEKPERQADIRRVQEWLPAAFAGADVIDVACGTGYWTRFIAPAARRTVCVDASIETLAIAGRRLPSHTPLLVGDAYRLPIRPGRFGAAFAGFWLSHVPSARRREFLLELHRVLAPGATVVLLDNLYIEGSNHAIAERDAQGNTYQRRRLEGGSTHLVLKNFPGEAELEDLAASVGGQRTEYTAWEYYWALRYAAPAERGRLDA
jgi:demethylmenaquinone methyltransferase/2-methoxy-6-polyprenyl-1,4-benzoquinol methylase